MLTLHEHDGNFGDAQYATQIQQQIKDRLRTVDAQNVEVPVTKSNTNN